jgi:hypothetical protein
MTALMYLCWPPYVEADGQLLKLGEIVVSFLEQSDIDIMIDKGGETLIFRIS